ncbi:restriction endonuclease subunit S [Vibrio cholerae]|nr:restriction endonuclease subunit S [Vibrio cholerae]
MSSNWKDIEFSKLCTITRGASPRPIQDFMSHDGVPWVKIADATSSDSRFIESTKEKIKIEGVAKSKKVYPGDLILSNSATPGLPKFMCIEACIHDGWMLLRDFKGLNKNFAYWLLLHERKKLVMQGNGSVFTNLKTDILKNHIVRIPSEDIQEKIASVLDSLQDKIELITKTNQTLELIAQAIFKSWFVDFDPVKAKIEALAVGGSADDAELAAMSVISAKTFDELHGLKARNPEAFNKLAQTAALFPAAMQDSELGEIPEGWEVKQLSEICQVINGRAYKNTEFKTEGTPIVRIQNLSNGGKTVYSDLELPPEKYIDREDFIYAWSATFGPHIWRGPKSIYHYHIWKMEVDESVISRYFLYLSMFRKTEAMKNAGTGSIFTHLTKKIMESQHVLIGDHAINKKFSGIIVPIFDQISSLKNESTDLADIRDALLPKLLTGDGLTSEVANV